MATFYVVTIVLPGGVTVDFTVSQTEFIQARSFVLSCYASQSEGDGECDIYHDETLPYWFCDGFMFKDCAIEFWEGFAEASEALHGAPSRALTNERSEAESAKR